MIISHLKVSDSLILNYPHFTNNTICTKLGDNIIIYYSNYLRKCNVWFI